MKAIEQGDISAQLDPSGSNFQPCHVGSSINDDPGDVSNYQNAEDCTGPNNCDAYIDSDGISKRGVNKLFLQQGPDDGEQTLGKKRIFLGGANSDNDPHIFTRQEYIQFTGEHRGWDEAEPRSPSMDSNNCSSIPDCSGTNRSPTGSNVGSTYRDAEGVVQSGNSLSCAFVSNPAVNCDNKYNLGIDLGGPGRSGNDDQSHISYALIPYHFHLLQ